MVIKKKNGKEEEVQDGWTGHVIPFELVQRTLLAAEAEALKQKEARLAEISAEYDEILDSLSEEEKESEVINEAKDGFVTAAVTNEAKQIKDDLKKIGAIEEDSYEAKILKVADLLTEERGLKTQVKSETARLHLLTKETIEKLSDEQAIALLEQKWIVPLTESIRQLPHTVIRVLVDKVKALSEKYALTYSAVEAEIRETKSTLASLMDELVGNEYDRKGLSEFQALLKGE